MNRTSTARRAKDRLFASLCLIATLFAVFILCVLLYRMAADGVGHLSKTLLTSMKSTRASTAGILKPLLGSLYVILLTAFFTVPVGIAAAIYLEEIQTRGGRLRDLIQSAIGNLAGVPSIVYGLLGLAVFVNFMALGRGILAGALTMSLLSLPVVILVSQEALRSVPRLYREASWGLGATKWQTIRYQVLPNARAGILSGVILALSRALGETAPLIAVGASAYVSDLPHGLKDGYSVLPFQIYIWSSRPETAFHDLAAATIVVLMVVLLAMNSVAIYLRAKSRKSI